jgi:hypothetical protein
MQHSRYWSPRTQEYSKNVLKKLCSREYISPLHASLWSVWYHVSRYTKYIIDIDVIPERQDSLFCNIAARVIEDQNVILGYQQANTVELEQNIFLWGYQRSNRTGQSQNWVMRDVTHKELKEIFSHKNTL